MAIDAQEEGIYEHLRRELRILSSHLPKERKSLRQLLGEERPHVICNDGTAHHFKRRELEYLASILGAEEVGRLLLPILIELTPSSSEASIALGSGAELKVVRHILGMEPTVRDERIILYRPQVAALRRALRTSTQYYLAVGAMGTS
ncbi:MAG: DUF61 family protein [Candidatus Bathyarchaeia archaeon]